LGKLFNLRLGMGALGNQSGHELTKFPLKKVGKFQRKGPTGRYGQIKPGIQ